MIFPNSKSTGPFLKTKKNHWLQLWVDLTGTAEPGSGTFNVPHSMTLAEDKGLLCVADRENGRIQCFDLDGNFQLMIHSPEFGDRIFAVSYCKLHGGLLFAVNGPSLSGTPPVQGFIIDINDGQLIETWNAKPVSWYYFLKLMNKGIFVVVWFSQK